MSVACLGSARSSFAQTYCSSAVPAAIPDNNATPTTMILNVPDTFVITSLSVTISITHTYIADIRSLQLVAPSGQIVALTTTTGFGGAGNDNFKNTTFDDTAAGVIGDATHNTAPIRTRVKGIAAATAPAGTISLTAAQTAGLTSAGNWTLRCVDSAGQDVGTIDYFILSFNQVTRVGGDGAVTNQATTNGLLVSQTGLNIGPIPDNNPATGSTSTTTIANTQLINGIDVAFSVTHASLSDLRVRLIHPNGTTFCDLVTPGTLAGSADTAMTNKPYMTLVTSDPGAPAFSPLPAAAPYRGKFASVNPLSVFNNLPSGGTWTLKVTDEAAGFTGTIREWSLHIRGTTVATGSCCSASGVCTETTLAGCSSVTDTFAGLATTCATVPCITGACCAPAPSGCSIVTTKGCTVGAAGTFQGPGTSCDAGQAIAAYSGPPIPIPDAVAAGVDSTINIASAFTIGTVKLSVSIPDHTYIGDLIIKLTHGANSVVVWNRSCGTNAGMNVTFDDAGAALLCAEPTVGTFAPANPLAAFAGDTSNGAWTLNVSDNAGIDTGNLAAWSLTVSSSLGSLPTCQGACCTNSTCVFVDGTTCQGLGGIYLNAGQLCTGSPCAHTGACCLIAGGCDPRPQSLCTGDNFYQGDNSTCGSCPAIGACCTGAACAPTFEVPCLAVSGNTWSTSACLPDSPCVGPCCSASGACSLHTAAECTGGGQTFGTLGNTCVNSPCVTGGCCAPAACTITTSNGCAFVSGSYQGDTSTCDPCVGPCCSSAGVCSLTTALGCVGNGQSFGTINTTCLANPCVTGGCCAPAACTITTSNGCTFVSGSYQGDSSTCDPCVGPCCSSAGVCSLTTALGCVGNGQTFGTLNTTCLANPCVSGACCTPSGCTIATSTGCTFLTGVYQNDGTSCASDYGAPTVSTMPIEDISATGTAFVLDNGTLDDGNDTNVPIGFTFNFYGVPQTLINIVTNGYAYFGNTSVTVFTPVAIPNAAAPNSLLAAYWCDMLPASASQITYQTLGSSPNRRFIIQWNNLSRYGGLGIFAGTHTFQIILYEGADAFAYRYGTLVTGTTPPPTNPVQATVGVEDATGATGTAYTTDLVAAGGNTALVFIPSGTLCASPVTGACNTTSGCESLSYAGCIAADGAYQGNGTTCGGAPLGGCCTTTTGVCNAAQITQDACETGQPNNHWIGVGLACTPTNCPLPGACCNGAGGCSVVPSTACAPANYQGNGSACIATNCGVCCRGSTCVTNVFTAAACTASVPLGSGAGASYVANTACGGANHKVPCCYADYNKVGGKTVADIFAYLTDWFAHSTYAWQGTPGPTGPGNPPVSQIFAFLSDWFAGC